MYTLCRRKIQHRQSSGSNVVLVLCTCHLLAPGVGPRANLPGEFKNGWRCRVEEFTMAKSPGSSASQRVSRNNPLPISLFTYYSLLIKFVPFLKNQPVTIPCKKKKMTSEQETEKKKGKETKESKREKSKQIHVKKSKFWLMHMRKKQKTLLNNS